jgi:uncharacterized protein involved in exopolysaccharide biosynthesis
LVFALVILVTVATAAVWLTQRDPRYEATAEVLVSPLAQDDPAFVGLEAIRDAGDPTRTMQTAASLVDSREAAVLAARRLDADWTPPTVDAAVDVQPQGESNILAITAEADDPDEAAAVANHFARAALDVRTARLRAQTKRLLRRLQLRQSGFGESSDTVTADLAARVGQLEGALAGGDPTVTLAQRAGPGTAIGASPTLILLLSLMAGVALAAAAAILLEAVVRPVSDVDEAIALDFGNRSGSEHGARGSRRGADRL